MRSMLMLLLIGGLALPVAAQTPSAPAAAGSPTATASGSSSTGDGSTQATPSTGTTSGDAAASTPAADTSGSAQAAPASDAPPPVPKAPPTIDQKHGILSLGYENSDISGSRNKFFQYATPPQGFFLDELRYVPFSKEGNLGVIDLRAPGEADFRNYAQFSYVPTWTEFEGLMTHNQFFEDTPQFVDPSERAVQQFSIEQRLGENFLLSTHHRLDQVDDNFQGGLDPLHQRTQYNDVVASGLLGRGFVNLTFSDWHYFDRTGVQPDTDVKRWQEDYERGIGTQTIGEQLRLLAISQAGEPNSQIQIASVSDNFALGNSSSGSLVLRQDEIDEPAVQDAYYREQSSATAFLAHSWPGWSSSVALQERSAQRVRSDHSYVDVPKWQTIVARASGKLSDTWRLSARGSTQSLWNVPVMDTIDSDDLLWNVIQDGEVRVDGISEDDSVSGYFSATFHRTSNTERATTVTSDGFNAGGNWQTTPKINLFTDLSYQQWLADNGTTAFPSIADFMPANEIASVGMNWVLTTRAFVGANYSHLITWNQNPLLLQDANTTGTYLSLQAQYETLTGQKYSLTVSPWTYHDSIVNEMDYQSTVAELTVSTPF